MTLIGARNNNDKFNITKLCSTLEVEQNINEEINKIFHSPLEENENYKEVFVIII